MKILNSIRYAIEPALRALGAACSLLLTFLILFLINGNKEEMLFGFIMTWLVSYYVDNSIMGILHYHKTKAFREGQKEISTFKLLSLPIYIICFSIFSFFLNSFAKNGLGTEVGMVVGVFVPFLLYTFMLKTLPWRWRPHKE